MNEHTENHVGDEPWELIDLLRPLILRFGWKAVDDAMYDTTLWEMRDESTVSSDERVRTGARMNLNPEPLRVTETKPGMLRCAQCKRDSRNCRCGPGATFEILGDDGEWW